MWSSSSEDESLASSPTRNPSPFPMEKRRSKKKPKQRRARARAEEEEEEEEMGWRGRAWEEAWPRKGRIGGGGGGGGGVMLEGYVEGSENGSEGGAGEGEVGRTKSLTDDDLEELKGCLDLGFGFSYEEIPELCSTLPALELCYSMSQRFLDEQSRSAEGDVAEPSAASPAAAASSTPIANWRISSPGDHPEEVKARLKYWAQAVACTVKLCS
uniref:Uncharacterized protein n=1 Tax=Ananas comosus var. bracteatus TaxID=296719 RepID=A0A6V7Q256_ANACO|nr:unnamed protein product [Ananas comosus var. bracteatus]